MQKSRKIARRKRKERTQKTKKVLNVWWVLFSLLTIGVLSYFFWKLNTLDKFSFVQKTVDNGANVIVFDPSKRTYLKIYIPSSTQLELSNDLGEYKLESVWKLAESEGLGSSLVTKTIVKNFSLPVYYYKDEKYTNLDIFKNIKIFLIENNLIHLTNFDYDLTLTDTLVEKKFLNGEEGYSVVNTIPSYILVNFAKSEFSEISPKAEVIDLSGNYSISDSISKVLSVLGVKVSTYSKSDTKEAGCFVYGKNTILVKDISSIFDCKIENQKKSESDITIEIGKNFADMY